MVLYHLLSNIFVISECPDRAVCQSRDVQHYDVFRHSLLANILAGIQS